MSSPNPYPPPGSGRSAPRTSPNLAPPGARADETREGAVEAVAYVYVPTRENTPTRTDGIREIQLELRRFPDGTAGLPIFTDPDQLVAQLGEFQPWAKIAVLELLLQATTAKLPVVLNPIVRDDADRWTAAGLDAGEGENR
jgi:hypothetical protein